MSKCCGARSCNCAVTAGPGVTVDGDGSPANPYVISAGAATPTGLGVTDTPTVDLALTGTGTPADPYDVSAAVILDPAPPGGGANLLEAGPDGLYVECADIRSCLTAGDGIAYDTATGEISARPSADAGNLVTIGTDGGLLATAPAAAPTAVEGGDTPTAHDTVSGTGSAADPYVVTTDVILDPAPPGGGTNLLEAGPDGLYVECADVRGCLSAGDGIAYDAATGEISARPSTDPGNAVTIGGDGGLYAPTPGAATVETACGLTGDGSAGDPLAANTGTWPYACDIGTNFTGVYCDPTTGELKGEPPLMQDYFNASQNGVLTPAIAVPAAPSTTVDTLDITVTNPDPCRPALGLLFREVDLDLDLPPNSGGATGLDNDEMSYLGNQGSATVFNTHVQENKINEVRFAPGETRTITLNIQAGRGSGGAMINRIQATLRVFLWSLPEA